MKTFKLILLIIVINILMFILYDGIANFLWDKYGEKWVDNYISDNEQNWIDEVWTAGNISEGDRTQDNERLTNHRKTAITEAVRLIEPAVVSVNVIRTTIVRQPVSFFLNYYIPIQQDVQSVGSGVLFTDDGYIITNAHVVDGATQITVVTVDNENYDATLIGIDNIHDVAIIKIEGTRLPFAKLGTSSDLMIGEWSIALGNPFAFWIADSKPTVSVGVISALNRNINNNNDAKIHKGMIQTDAAINPGNSGGPLVNIYGEVIGINSFIFTDNQGSIGIGFAIPIDRVKNIADELITYGKMREPYYGLKIQEITIPIARSLGLPTLDGVIVSVIEENSPAETSGLKRGDIITKINEIVVRNSSDAVLGLTDVTPGDEVSVLALRNGREHRLIMVAGEYH